jgi:hypothetical protein
MVAKIIHEIDRYNLYITTTPKPIGMLVIC